MIDATWNFTDVLSFLGWMIVEGFCIGVGAIASMWVINKILK